MARRVREAPAETEAPSWLFDFVLTDWAEPLPDPNPLQGLAYPDRAVEIYARGRWADARRTWCKAQGVDQKTFRAMTRERKAVA
jgi:hypothetical protein